MKILYLEILDEEWDALCKFFQCSNSTTVKDMAFFMKKEIFNRSDMPEPLHPDEIKKYRKQVQKENGRREKEKREKEEILKGRSAPELEKIACEREALLKDRHQKKNSTDTEFNKTDSGRETPNFSMIRKRMKLK